MSESLPIQKHNVVRGRLLALLVIPVGVALWILLWSWGFMSALVAFAIAYGAIWLFKLGAKTQPSRTDVYYLLAVIAVGVVAAFLGGMISDAWNVWSTEVASGAEFFGVDFWSFVGQNITNGDLWKSYMTDILIAIVFAALGAGVLVKDLLQANRDDTSKLA